MRHSLFVVLLGLIISSAALAQTASTLDGWRQFKFGMTSDQARALPPPGKPWRYTPPNYNPAPFLFSAGPIDELGSALDSVGMGFTVGKRLNAVLLVAKTNGSTEDCKKSFQTLLMALEAQYSSFVPGYRTFPGADVRSIAGAKSQYQYAASRGGDAQLRDIIWMDARRRIGERYLSVGTTHMADGTCMTMLKFNDHNPVNPNAPSYRRSDGSYGRPNE